MFGVDDWHLYVVSLEKVEQSLLALNLRQLALIAVTPQ